MTRALLLVPYLLRALAYAAVILAAAVLRPVLNLLPTQERKRTDMTFTMTVASLLSSYPPALGSHSDMDAEHALRDLREWAESAKTALDLVEAALDYADVPTKLNHEEGDPIKNLDAADRINWLALQLSSKALELAEMTNERDHWRQSRNAEYKELVEHRGFAATREAQLSREQARADAAVLELDLVRAALSEAGAPLDVTRDQAVRWLAGDLGNKLREQRDRADRLEEDRNLLAGLAKRYEGELGDLGARAEALESEVAMLEDHIDAIDGSDDADCWVGWDDAPGSEDDAIVRHVAHAPDRAPRTA